MERASLWDALVAMQGSINAPWLVLGDFNVVLDEDDKSIASGRVLGVSSELGDFVFASGLTYLRYYGQFYTWTNSHT